MHIIYVGTLPPHRGGSAFVAAQLLPGLVDRGHHLTAIAPRAPGAQIETASVFEQSIRSIRFPMPYDETDMSRPPDETYQRQQTERIHGHLNRLLAAERADLILVGRESFVWGIHDLAARERIPWVLQCHGGILPILRLYPESRGGQMLAEMAGADRIICCARHLAEVVSAAGLSRVVAIPNSVDLARYRPSGKDPALLRALELEPSTTVALHVSNLKGPKRLADLFDAAAIVAPRCPGLRYVIAGDGPDRADVEAACRARGVSDRFRFMGWVKRERMSELINLADMMIMPSVSEGMSLACLEAMACACLVIASDIPGSCEIITAGRTGLLFRTGDVADLAATILRAAGDRELRARIGQAARVQVEQQHRLDQMVTRYESLLHGLLAQREPGYGEP